MPAQKRSPPENPNREDPTKHHCKSHARQSRDEEDDLHREEDQQPDQDEDMEQVEQDEEDKEEEGGDSEGSPSSNSDEKPEYVLVELPEIRKEVQCPICLGIIKKTRTVMDCLHRFCRDCIDKSIRLGNNECPACRKHCASRRSLRDDPNFDALIAALYPDIAKYEEEELAFHDEDRTRNQQIQASIAQIVLRQARVFAKKRAAGKDTVPTSTYMSRSQRNLGPGPSWRRRNCHGPERQASEDHEDENYDNVGKDSSSTDERGTEARQRRGKRRVGSRSCQPSSSAANDVNCVDNESEVCHASKGIPPGLNWKPETLAWGRGGARSHTRHGNSSGCNNKNSRSTRLNKLVEYLRSLEENNDELDVHLKLVSLDKQNTPNLEQPYLCCRPSLSVKQLCEAEDIEICMVKGQHDAISNENQVDTDPSNSVGEVQILEAQEIMARLKVPCTSSRDHLILAYRQKQTN
ncbi:putative E3 ubiquitin-protein ligase RING1a isoform X2 [Carica papaya]|uniref:putative E3 ubiquitin-protein ligase RING1a isoform X2 n=1 Tax=Carica papaya TaxID=3649 RepID=UPI000B8CE28A|nr:putative E3 ubiquitin-protein ligase RING1a isoform X2 [Carica papaya]